MSVAHFDHIKFWVGNAKQAAHYYCTSFGFRSFAYRGLETGSRMSACHVVKQGKIIMAFESPLLPNNQEFGNFLSKHGDGVRDVAFCVENLDHLLERCSKHGATIVRNIWTESDKDGIVRMAAVQTYGDTVHTLVERGQYGGPFLPGFQLVSPKFHSSHLQPTNLLSIDHVVGNQPEMQMQSVVSWYERMMGLNRFWSVDDDLFHSGYSALNATVVTNNTQSFLISICEPTPSDRKGKSQIQEFLDYNGGPGVQHIALTTNNIIDTVEVLRSRGVEFLSIPDTYYESLVHRLKSSSVKIQEEMDKIRKLGILVDFDENGYLMQIFTKPVQDRPTLFIEIIQRRNFSGFGAGNFKALFESIELEQMKRGTLFHKEHTDNSVDETLASRS